MEHGSSAALSALHPDIIESNILTRLDGPTLASTSCSSSTLHSLSDQPHLWSHICHSTWPSTASSPRLHRLISSFPDGGPRAFFSLSFPLPTSSLSTPHRPPPQEIISAVDIYYQNHLIFSKVQDTETGSEWFRCSPFRIDLLDPKDVIPTKIPQLESDDNCTVMLNDMTLSWILIDPTRKQAVNLSSFSPVTAQRHWLTGEVQVRFASIFSGEGGEPVQCGIVVVCGASEGGGEMQVREVSLEVEDMEGMHLNGKDSLVILERALEGKSGRKGVKREEEGRRRYEEYVERKSERRERKVRTEGALDMLSVGFGVIAFSVFWFFAFCK